MNSNIEFEPIYTVKLQGVKDPVILKESEIVPLDDLELSNILRGFVNGKELYGIGLEYVKGRIRQMNAWDAILAMDTVIASTSTDECEIRRFEFDHKEKYKIYVSDCGLVLLKHSYKVRCLNSAIDVLKARIRLARKYKN
ncbi:hypothetical protein HLBENOHH_02450 [Aeromonas dhakensis]|uniref:hypothetical protein n=1 Tax=Aeromonas dhakensis TaxID=196024 RepID=UPI00366C499A